MQSLGVGRSLCDEEPFRKTEGSSGRKRWRVGSAFGVRMGSGVFSWRESRDVSDEKKCGGGEVNALWNLSRC